MKKNKRMIMDCQLILKGLPLKELKQRMNNAGGSNKIVQQLRDLLKLVKNQ